VRVLTGENREEITDLRFEISKRMKMGVMRAFGGGMRGKGRSE
jgi:hypothetical protein